MYNFFLYLHVYIELTLFGPFRYYMCEYASKNVTLDR